MRRQVPNRGKDDSDSTDHHAAKPNFQVTSHKLDLSPDRSDIRFRCQITEINLARRCNLFSDSLRLGAGHALALKGAYGFQCVEGQRGHGAIISSGGDGVSLVVNTSGDAGASPEGLNP